MDLLTRLTRIDPAWSGAGVTAAALLVALLLRLLLPASQRERGRGTLWLLTAALVLRLAALGAARVPGLELAAAALRATHVVALVVGLVSLAALVAFDIVLARADVRVPSILRNLVRGTVAAAVLLWLWREATGDIVSLVTTSAVLAVLGLALQGTITNVLAGLTLQLERSFALGQWIQVGDQVGKVLEVRTRHTALLTRDGDVVIVPNADLVGSQVLSLGGPGGAQRVTCRVGFHYRHPPNAVKQVLLAAVRDVPGVLAFPPPDCLVVGFGDSAVEYGLRYWLDDFEQQVTIESDVCTRVWYAARRAALEIPYPMRVLVPPTGEAAGGPGERADHAAALARVELFGGLSDADRDLLAGGTQLAHFAAGERILRQGDPGDSLYLVSEGTVSVRLGVDALEREVAQLGPGQMLGEMSLVTGEPRQASCVAITDVACRVVDREAFRQLLDARPEVAEVVSKVLAARQAELEGEREGLSAAARTRRAAETQRRLLGRIRSAFHLD